MIRAASSLVPRLALAAGIAAALSAVAQPSPAYQRTLKYVTTGNGFGFQVYDADQNKIVEFLEHPYRYLRPKAKLTEEGVIRRNLVWDVYFGVKGPGGAGWLNTASGSDPDYVDQSNIIRAPLTLGGMATESYYFAPYGYDGNAMIAILHAPTATDGYLMLNFHLGSGESQPGAEGESIKPVAGQAAAVMETGPGGGAMVYVGLSGVDHFDCMGAHGKVGQEFGDNSTCSGNDQTVGLQKKLSDGWWAVGLQFVENAADAEAAAAGLKAWADGRSGEQILQGAKAEFEAWRQPPPEAVSFKSEEERKLWRQSEAVLRMGQVREPYTATRKNHGMVLASLPHGEWHSGWVRDAMYGIVALARTRHDTETRDALNFFLDAAPVGVKYGQWFEPKNYRISTVRYFGSGEEDADFSGQSTPNIEVDGWGTMIWASRQYVDASGDTGWLTTPTRLDPSKTVYEVLVEGVAEPLADYLEPTGIVKKDSGIWEVHQGYARHFAYTTLAAARGFCDMAALAKRLGKADDVQRYQALHAKVVAGFASYFKDANGAFVGSGPGEGKTSARIDGAVVEVFTWNIVKDYSAPYVKPTFDLLGQLQVQSGGYKRNDEGQSSYDNHEWILIDLRMADALRRYGNEARADQLISMIVDKASVNFRLIPELYSAVTSDAPIGNYHGSIPMVGYGAGAYIMTLFDRDGLIEPNDCGTEEAPPVDGGSGGSGGGGPGQGGGGPGQGGTGEAGTGGGGCTDPLSCGPNAADTSEIPRKAACLCGAEPSAPRPAGWLSLGLLPLAFVARRLLRRGTRPWLS
jgi:hypothetical protein